jgi:hypothetical protein
MLTQEQIEKLERYHKGILSDNEKVELEREVLENPELKEEAFGLLDLYKGFNAIQLENFKADVDNWEKESRSEKTITDKKEAKVVSIGFYLSRYKYLAAAVILLLMLPAGYLLYQNMGSSKTDKLFADNATHYSALDLKTRSMTADANDPLEAIKEKGINSYNKEQYQDALNYLNEYYSKASENYKTSDLKLYLALSNLFSNKSNEAVTFLTEIISKENSGNYKEVAQWYLALAYLKLMKISESTDLLKKISETPTHAYQAKAKTLLPELEALK